MRRRTSLIAVIVSAACFGTLAVLTNLAYEAWPGGKEAAQPLALLAWRFILTALLMAAYQLVRNPKSLKVGVKDIGRFSMLALTGYGAASICFFFALRYADASVVAVLLYTYPAIVALAAWLLLGERFTPWRVAGIAVTFIGCAVVLDLMSARAVAPMGIALGLGAALGYASFNMLSHRWVGRQPRLVLMTYTFGISGVAIALVALATGVDLSVVRWSAELWGLLGAIVLVPTFAAIVLYLEGIRGLGAAQAAVVSTFEPIFTIILAGAVLGERLSAVQWVGAALVIGGVVAAELGARQPRAEEIPAV